MDACDVSNASRSCLIDMKMFFSTSSLLAAKREVQGKACEVPMSSIVSRRDVTLPPNPEPHILQLYWPILSAYDPNGQSAQAIVDAVEKRFRGHGVQETAPLFASVSVTKPGLHCKQAKLVAL